MRRVPPLSSRLQGFGTTIFAEMTRLAEQHQAINLSQGFPDFAGPTFLKDAACTAIHEERNQYARMRGELALTQAIVDGVQARHGLTYDAATEALVFAGATEGILCAFLALCDPGDEVVLFEPYYDSYRACASIAGASPHFVTLHAPDFRWDPLELRAAFTPRTRLVVVNTPHNPTGRVLGEGELQEIADLCLEHDVLCLTDEVYDRLVYEGRHQCLAAFPEMRERTVVLNSTGKTFSLTGWKIGYATAPRPLIDALASAHQFATFAVATPFQHAMAQALRAPASYFDELLLAYRERRALLVDGLRAAGFGVLAPEGTYFAVADIRPLGWDDDIAFCRHLVESVGVAAIPPSVFYAHPEHGRHLVRFAFCKKHATLEEGVARLQRAFAG